MFSCTLCGEAASVRINKLNYCSKCFIVQMENKCLRNLRKLPYKSKIQVFVKETLQSFVMIYILNKLKNKKIHYFDICCANMEKYKSFFSNISFPEFNEKNSSYDFYLYQETVEDISKNIFLTFIKGESDLEFDKNSNKINLFKDVKNKEIQFYSWLHKDIFNFTFSSNENDKLTNAINAFITQTDKNNSLALFNILNTVKKL